jgi:hypothetical protein
VESEITFRSITETLRSKSRVSSLLLVIITAALPAHASRLWSWSYSGNNIAASGTLTTLDNPNAQGGYLITGISGNRNGTAITALQQTGTWIPGNEPFAVDNLLFPGPGPQLTKHGFGFALADGTYSNPFFADFLPTPDYLEFYSMPNSGSSTELPVTFAATPVPEPTSFALMLVALLFCPAVFRIPKRRERILEG